MAKLQQDWYAPEWLSYFDKKQADLERDLDWNKSKASLIMRGKQRYHRDDVNALSAYLNLEPFELLIPPDRAMSLRQFVTSARQIAGANSSPSVVPNDEIGGRNLAKAKARSNANQPRKTGTHD